MKKKILPILMGAFLSLGVVSCNSENKPTPTPTPTPSPDEYVTPPSYEEDAIWFHYYREDGIYDGYHMWLWQVNEDGTHTAFNKWFEFNGKDEFGMIGAYPTSLWSDISKEKIGFIIAKNEWEEKDVNEDIYLSMNDFTKDENGIYHVYFISGDATPYHTKESKNLDVIKSCKFINEKRVAIEANHNIKSYKFYKEDELIKEETLSEPDKIIGFNLDEEADFECEYSFFVTFLDSNETYSSTVDKTKLYSTLNFNNKYTYDGELGAIYSKTSTTFRVWSPVCNKIKLRIYESGTPTSISKELGNDKYEEHEMKKQDKGVFELTLDGDLNGKFYTYVITNSSYIDEEIIDPYAKSSGINGIRGMIIDFDDTRATPQGWATFSPNIHNKTELTVYETHVADVTSSSSWQGNEQNRKKYKGMIESGTTYKEDNKVVKTGFDHIKELGVNAVQLLPIFDQDNDEVNTSFNWGYNPLNYNVIEGSYSSNPYDGYTKVKEFRELVEAYGENDINIIMDVVYNHVSNLASSSFNKLMPGYYFRYDSKNQASNGSGCGNETASEMKMMRKFIKDSTLFLAKTYKLSGFRFDLMGLHDIDTMNEIVTNLKTNYNEKIIVYGEPWTGGTSSSSAKLANQTNISSWKGFSAFNDTLRDSIKGSVFTSTETGWATASITLEESYLKIVSSIKGIANNDTDPLKKIAYVTCHDNNTLYDKLQLSVTDSSSWNDLSVLCNSIVFTSQGISFMNAGEEMLRSKVNEDGSLNENSYNASYKTNELDYSRLIKYNDVYKDYQNMIKLKQELNVLHYETSEEIKENISFNETDSSYLDYELKDNDNKYRIIHASYALKDNTLDLSNYELIYDTLSRNELSSSYKLEKMETLVLKEKQ